jgi:6-phosphogluconolactonase (cycloisomerase 2 family)
VNPTNGTLTLVANAPTRGNRPRSFGIDPEGTLLFAGNQNISEVGGFRIDATPGR